MLVPQHRKGVAAIGLFITVFTCVSLLSAAQKKEQQFDSTYYKAFPKMITTRFYFSQKYTSLTLEAPAGTRSLNYLPNTAVNAGMGATYGALTLNLGVSLGFLNPDKKEKGETKSLDLQSHIYTRHWVIDLYGQFYEGYYLRPRGLAADNIDNYYQRPDINVNLIGASVYRLVNSKRFSYRSSFLQNEWQQKSAGSLLIGAEVYNGVISGDSTLVPATFGNTYTQQGVRKVRFTEFGPGVGYAYTAVWKKHFFVTGSTTLNADLSFVKESSTTGDNKRTSISPNVTLRAVIGYNSNSWVSTLSWVNNNTNLRGPSSREQYLIRTGNFRLTLAKRLKPGKKLKRRLEVID
jgi:Domain of unknown function (DUF4421)